MQNIRKIGAKWYVNLPLSLLLLAFMTQCQTESKKDSVSSPYSGEELFTATFFAYGDLASQLSTQGKKYEMFQEMPAEERADYEQRIALFTKYIKESDPFFFEKFKQEVDSKDQLRIREALNDGAFMIAQNFEKVFPELQPLLNEVEKDARDGSFVKNGTLDIEKINSKRAEYDRLLSENMLSPNGKKTACTLGLACAVYLALAVHEYVAITLAAAVAIMTWKWIAFAEMQPYGTTTDPLQVEIMVNDLAELKAQ